MRGESAAEASGPTQEGREILVPGGHGTAFVAPAGKLVESVDVAGPLVAGFVAFAERSLTAWLSLNHTRSSPPRPPRSAPPRPPSNPPPPGSIRPGPRPPPAGRPLKQATPGGRCATDCPVSDYQPSPAGTLPVTTGSPHRMAGRS